MLYTVTQQYLSWKGIGKPKLLAAYLYLALVIKQAIPCRVAYSGKPI
jgi:hypothetical protein